MTQGMCENDYADDADNEDEEKTDESSGGEDTAEEVTPPQTL